jgi:RNA polymerase sigma-70 factor (ECF subfamily)
MDITPKLLKDCLAEKRRAQQEMYRLCYPVMMSVCSRYERNQDDAEALLNQAFLKVLTKLDTYKERVPFEAWLRRITLNTAIDQHRAKKRSKLDYHEEPGAELELNDQVINEAEMKHDAEELLGLIQKLPPMSQQVFNMYVIDGYNHKEIAQKLSMTEGTSKWHLSNARKNLKQMLHKLMNNVALLL